MYNPNRKEVKGKTKKPERKTKWLLPKSSPATAGPPPKSPPSKPSASTDDEIFAAMDDTTFDKVTDYFTGWILRENPKARFNYWAKKAGVTEEMVNIYLTI